MTEVRSERNVNKKRTWNISRARRYNCREHEVLFAGIDEVIEFKHTAYSRTVFGKGAVEAAKFLAGKEAGKIRYVRRSIKIILRGILGQIAGMQSTKQSVNIIVGKNNHII